MTDRGLGLSRASTARWSTGGSTAMSTVSPPVDQSGIDNLPNSMEENASALTITRSPRVRHPIAAIPLGPLRVEGV